MDGKLHLHAHAAIKRLVLIWRNLFRAIHYDGRTNRRTDIRVYDDCVTWVSVVGLTPPGSQRLRPRPGTQPGSPPTRISPPKRCSIIAILQTIPCAIQKAAQVFSRSSQYNWSLIRFVL